MSVCGAVHDAHLDAEQAEGDRLEELAQVACVLCGHANEDHVDNGDGPTCARMVVADIRGGADECGCPGWHAATGLPLEPPPSPEDEETLPIDPERTAA